MPKPDGPHYLRTNAHTKLPRRHVFFDTEAQISYDAGVQVQTWQCGAAEFHNLDTRKRTPVVTRHDYLTPQEFWDDVSGFCRPGTRTILWAHNLAYDLRTSAAFKHLPERDFRLRAVTLDGLSTWARFTRDKASLICADLTSWIAQPLARIAADLGMVPEPLPLDLTDVPAMLKRCRQDAAILAAAVREILRWLEADDLGNWQITGSAQALSCFRHKHLTHKLLVHGNPVVWEDRKSVE